MMKQVEIFYKLGYMLNYLKIKQANQQLNLMNTTIIKK